MAHAFNPSIWEAEIKGVCTPPNNLLLLAHTYYDCFSVFFFFPLKKLTLY